MDVLVAVNQLQPDGLYYTICNPHPRAPAQGAVNEVVAGAGPRGADDVAQQQRLPVLDRAWAQVVAAEVKDIEGDIGEPLGPALAQRVGQEVDVGEAALIGW